MCIMRESLDTEIIYNSYSLIKYVLSASLATRHYEGAGNVMANTSGTLSQRSSKLKEAPRPTYEDPLGIV